MQYIEVYTKKSRNGFGNEGCAVREGKVQRVSIQKGKGRKLKRKRKGLKIFITIIVLLVVGGLFSFGYFLYEKVNSGLFFENTVLNGYDVSGKTCKEVLLILEQDYSAPTLEIREQDETALTLTLEEMGYTIDQMTLLNSIENCMRQQNLSLLLSLMDGNTFEVEVPFEFDETVFHTSVSAQNLAEERVASTDAYMDFNGTEYFIEPETYGNEIDDADLQVMVKDYVDNLIEELDPQKSPVTTAQIDIPESFYFLPAVTQDDSEMNRTMNIYNSFCKAKITLDFGEDAKEVTDWSDIQNWLIIDGDEVTLDEEPIYNYMYELSAKYDTLYYPHDFTTTSGEVIHFESSDHGYRMDEDATATQFIQDIYSNAEVEREPVYEVKGYKRNGRDDFAGCYVEVNLTEQHLWFYMDGKLVVETDIVSGLPKDERETATGIFAIPYKKSPEVLKGDTWEEEVTYWMPFYDGQGLHDAPWRSSFGGNIYKTSGSHGCVNLPYDAAKKIYDSMEERVPIILYK